MKKSKILKAILIVILIVILTISMMSLVGCREAYVVRHNIQKDADYFNVYRRMTFINLRTDKILYTAEGYFSLQDTDSNGTEIGIIFKTGEDEYKINYFSKHENVSYIIEQTENTHTDPYYWEIKVFVPLPDFE